MQTKRKTKIKAAKAIFDLYKAMPDDVQKEVKELILLAERTNVPVADELTLLADESFSDIWNSPENDHWDDFLKKQSK